MCRIRGPDRTAGDAMDQIGLFCGVAPHPHTNFGGVYRGEGAVGGEQSEELRGCHCAHRLPIVKCAVAAFKTTRYAVVLQQLNLLAEQVAAAVIGRMGAVDAKSAALKVIEKGSPISQPVSTRQ
jgi:hypothetical protein